MKNTYTKGLVAFMSEIMENAQKVDENRNGEQYRYFLGTDFADILVGTYGVRIPRAYLFIDVMRLANTVPRAFCPCEKTLDDFRVTEGEQDLHDTQTTRTLNNHSVSVYTFADGTEVWIDTRLLKRFEKCGRIFLKAARPNSTISVYGEYSQFLGVVLPIMNRNAR